MAFIDIFRERLNAGGWMSFASLYFDNSCTLTVYATRGYCAYSPGKNCFIWAGNMDTTDSAIIENRFNIIHDNTIGMQQTTTFMDGDVLQHFDLAMFSHYGFIYDGQEKYPYPKIPTEAELDALTKDPETGLYPNTDTAVMLSRREVSTIGMYKAFESDRQVSYSGAVVDEFKMWYKNHKKFITMISEAYGITDAI